MLNSEPTAAEPTFDPAFHNYDAAIDWPRRIEAQGPMLARVLATGPSRRVLDLGSGTGEMSAWLASQGFEVVGIEGVKERWQVAVAAAPSGVEHLIGDLGAVEAMVRGHFGAAVCLGGTLTALLGAESIARMLVGLRRRLSPGAPLVADLENYDRLRAQGALALPPRVIARPDGDLVFLRLLDLREDGVVDATEAALRHRPLTEPTVELLSSRPVFRQGWTLDELRTVLEVAQFESVLAYGDFAGSPFAVADSEQLVVVAR
jgi:SAM-dependent methyltransferase